MSPVMVTDHRWMLKLRSRNSSKTSSSSSPSPSSSARNSSEPDDRRQQQEPHFLFDPQPNRTLLLRPSPALSKDPIGAGVGGGSRASSPSYSLYASNGFLRRASHSSRPEVSLPGHQRGRTQSMAMVGVVAGLFLFMTFVVTLAVIVICRRRSNSVFAALTSSSKTDDDDDGREYEMDDVITEADVSQSEVDTDASSWTSANQTPASDHVTSRAATPLDDWEEESEAEQQQQQHQLKVMTRRSCCSCRRQQQLHDSYCGHERLVTDCETT